MVPAIPVGPVAVRPSARRRPLTIDDYRHLARRSVPRMVWSFIDGGADREQTLRANTGAFDEWVLRPRVLTGAAAPDLSTPLGTATAGLPVYVSPTGMTGLTHRSGEPALARAAERCGTRAVISTAASYTVEEIAAATERDHFFQLYPWTSATTGEPLARRFIDRARAAGFGARFVTVDVPVAGNRIAERRSGMGVPPEFTPAGLLDAARHPRWCCHLLRSRRVAARMLVDERGVGAGVRSARRQQSLLDATVTWDDIARIRDMWHGPLYVKGILDPADAEAAVRCGADGVVVSNHGGRQLDGAPAALRALPAVVDRIGGTVPVLMDGGVRSGVDVVKALALGATAVGIGRPALYGLAAEGEEGVVRVLGILRDEIVRTLTLMGVASASGLGRRHIADARGG
ncbi:alpha-hydroxy acid oxidase [Tomitella gaofuii]|uniref:alpha-hydroxy acid oxidase n=1 Tax=Tomitella gaofuii TaxID=2760083 RepID=UPI001F3546C0|nr:alpha-hydroxy acid oxidase [Tomitella gaofuii]